MNQELSSTCPFQSSQDDRKSARTAAERVTPEPGARVAGTFALAREVLRSAGMKEAIPGVERFKAKDPTKVPVIFLDGEVHRSRRAAISRFFTPKAIATRYRAVMEQCTDKLLGKMEADGKAYLDRISFQLAVTVAAVVVGLTNSNQAGLASRIKVTLASGLARRSNWAAKLVTEILRRYHGLNFFYRDVRPAIAARRKQRQDDVISHLLDEGYSDTAILIECMTYASAGMVTTREFIVMAAWHLFEKDELRMRFLAGGEDDQFAILEEILRLEPVASMLHRRADADIAFPEIGQIPANTLVAIDIRAANTDEAVTGPCPYALDPDRAKRMKVSGSFMAFGDGSHRCPGAQVALHETRVFLDRLLRVPGIRLEREPELRWYDELGSYELRNALVVCDRR